jgi:site-specific DNA-methyltransferase (adenine-specific)
MAVAIEDAGFEIRDSIDWIYGSGFPKSLDVSKAIDKAAGVEREDLGPNPNRQGRHQDFRGGSLIGDKKIEDATTITRLTAPATLEAAQWSGYGTALKPAHEIIYLARKPLSEPNVAANVLKWGTGGLNIDGSRIGSNHWTKKDGAHSGSEGGHLQQIAKREAGVVRESSMGRWPSNIILSHDPNCNGSCVEGCPVAELDEQSGPLTSGDRNGHRNKPKTKNAYGQFQLQDEQPSKGDSGFASRFFHTAEWSDDDLIPFLYVAKASRSERDKGLEDAATRTMNRVNAGGIEHDPRWAPIQVKNNHPTVKPIKLFEYLIKLVTPKGGITIDPFCGSGSSLRAAERNGFHIIGIDLSADNCEIGAGRITGNIPPLFRGLEAR